MAAADLPADRPAGLPADLATGPAAVRRAQPLVLVVAATAGELAGVPAGDPAVVALACGVGPVDAAASTARALAELRPAAVLHVGIAGARRAAGLPLRSVVIGSAAVYDDATDTRWVTRHVEPDIALLTALRNVLPGAVAIPVSTSARVGGGANGGACVEAMEGFAVLRACALAGIPAVELRVISNEIEERDRAKWDLAGALAVLAECLAQSALAVAAICNPENS